MLGLCALQYGAEAALFMLGSTLTVSAQVNLTFTTVVLQMRCNLPCQGNHWHAKVRSMFHVCPPVIITVPQCIGASVTKGITNMPGMP